MRPGRPKEMFSKASDRTKRRTTEALRSAVDVEDSLMLHRWNYDLAGKETLPKSWKTSVCHRSGRPNKKEHSLRVSRTKKNKDDTRSALAMFVEEGLSRRQYEIIRSTHKHIGISLLQSSTKGKTKTFRSPDVVIPLIVIRAEDFCRSRVSRGNHSLWCQTHIPFQSDSRSHI
jgi:hypothetical protein